MTVCRVLLQMDAESLGREEASRCINSKVNGGRPWLAFGPHGGSRCSQPFIRSLNISRLIQASLLRHKLLNDAFLFVRSFEAGGTTECKRVCYGAVSFSE